MKRKRNDRKRRRPLNLESLESRRLLTFAIDSPYVGYNPSPDDSITIEAGSQARIDLLENDLQPGYTYAPRYQWIDTIDLTYRIDSVGTSERVESVAEAQAGSHELLADHRTLIYTPETGFTGIDQFTYVGLDRGGKSYTATITINVVHPIAAIPDWYRIDQGSDGITLDVLENDGANHDPSYDSIASYRDPNPVADPTLTITSVESPSAGGTVSISDDGEYLIYTPATEFTGLETFTYTVANADGSTATTFVDLRVTDTYDTTAWTEWWKHQMISSSLEANHGYGVTDGIHSYWPWIDAVDFEIPMWFDPITLSESRAVAFDLDENFGYSITNTQVAGIDQGDLVKTDGRYIYVVSLGATGQSQLSIFDAVDPHALPLLSHTQFDGTPLELYLMGDSLLLVSQSESDVLVTNVDLSDRSDPSVDRFSTVPGWFKESRVIDGIVQIYTSLHSFVPLDTVCPEGSTKHCFNETRSQWVERILNDPALHQPPSVDTFEGSADSTADPIDSNAIAPYVEILNTQTLLVAALFDSSERTLVSQQIIGSADSATLYVAQDGLFVFNQTYAELNSLRADPIEVFRFDPGAAQLSINRFDFSSDATTMTWSATGTIDGQLLNSFSVGYHDGSLQVAVTQRGRTSVQDLEWDGWTNSVIVLRQDAQSLTVVGETAPFAEGEQIYSARFVEDQAFVVTFRQIDPLFVIDLGDPANPVVTGELEMPDYSQYLHPIGNDFLIGVGRDTDQRGWPQGMQVSLFDVRDAQTPALHDKLLLGLLNSPLAQGVRGLSDHRAFSYYESHQMLALPVFSTHSWRGSLSRSSVLLIRVDPTDGIEQVGEIEFSGSAVSRTIRIGDVIYSISDKEIQAHDLSDPTDHLIKQTLDGLPSPTPVVPVDPPHTSPVDPPPVDPEQLETVVRITPHLVDEDGNSVETVDVGQTVWLEVTATDARWMQQFGVFSSYFDVDFGDAEVELAGDAEFSDAFWVQRRDPAELGWRGIGATQGLSNEADPFRPWVLRVPIRFNASGQVTVGLTPSNQPGLETLMYGRDIAIPRDSIETESIAITVAPAVFDPMDVNRDGVITLLDPLNIINRLMEHTETPEATIDIDQHDVNRDGEMTANDIVILINYIENVRQQDQTLAQILEASKDDDPEPTLDQVSTLF